jgi:hypothetical protein
LWKGNRQEEVKDDRDEDQAFNFAFAEGLRELSRPL